jgi:prevent-host-death family protein
MIVNVRESKAKLSELIARAAGGEEVLITVRGEPKAKLVSVQPARARNDCKKWASELRKWQQAAPRKNKANTSREIIDELRAERW